MSSREGDLRERPGNLDATESTYRDTFGFPTTRDGESVVVRMGATTVAFRAEPTLSGTHHLAWTIPTGTFDAAVAWASERVPLLLGNGGASVFEAPPTWDARSVYVDGPDGQLLELIERRALPASPRGAGFTADDIVRVSEVGVAVPDVVAAVDACAAAGSRPTAAHPTRASPPWAMSTGSSSSFPRSAAGSPRTTASPRTARRRSWPTCRGPSSSHPGASSCRARGERPPPDPRQKMFAAARKAADATARTGFGGSPELIRSPRTFMR